MQIYDIYDSKFSTSCSLPVLNCYLTHKVTVLLNIYYSKLIESLFNHDTIIIINIIWLFFMALSIPSLLIPLPFDNLLYCIENIHGGAIR